MKQARTSGARFTSPLLRDESAKMEEERQKKRESRERREKGGETRGGEEGREEKMSFIYEERGGYR